jgi:hypothetical protein
MGAAQLGTPDQGWGSSLATEQQQMTEFMVPETILRALDVGFYFILITSLSFSFSLFFV